jgi:hypothetical protein
MSTQFTVTPPSTLGEAIVPLGQMPDTEFHALVKALSSPRSFSLSKGTIEDLRKQTPSVAPSLTYLLGVLSFLYSQVDRVVEMGESYDSVITKLVEEVKANDHPLLKDRLSIILNRTEARKRFRKIRRLQSGFIPNATGFSTFVDLRPDFGDSDALDLKGFVKVIQLRVSTDSENPREQRFVVQLNKDSLHELKKAVDRATEKLEMLNNQNIAALPIIEI